jgi:hypothetical protein
MPGDCCPQCRGTGYLLNLTTPTTPPACICHRVGPLLDPSEWADGWTQPKRSLSSYGCIELRNGRRLGQSCWGARYVAIEGEIQMPPPAADQLFQVAIFLASTCAAVFWFCSATGQTVASPWRRSEKVPPEALAAHQAKWNARAAAAAAVTALLQGIQILYHMLLLHP